MSTGATDRLGDGGENDVDGPCQQFDKPHAAIAWRIELSAERPVAIGPDGTLSENGCVYDPSGSERVSGRR